jgi:hypothetical protein
MRVLFAGMKSGAPCNSRCLDSSWSVSGHDRFDIPLCERSALLTAEDLQCFPKRLMGSGREARAESGGWPSTRRVGRLNPSSTIGVAPCPHRALHRRGRRGAISAHPSVHAPQTRVDAARPHLQPMLLRLPRRSKPRPCSSWLGVVPWSGVTPSPPSPSDELAHRRACACPGQARRASSPMVLLPW